MERMVGKHQGLPLIPPKSTLAKIKVGTGHQAIKLVPDQRISPMGQMDPDLMFPPRMRDHTHPGIGGTLGRETLQHLHVGLGRRPIQPNTILDRHGTRFVPAQRRINGHGPLAGMPVNHRVIGFFDPALLPQPTQESGSHPFLGDQNESTGLTIKAIDQVGLSIRSEVLTDPADQTRQGSLLGRMTHQPRRFVDHKEIPALVNDFKK
tara:strand:+ start:2464 stop:3084 length:621 start_codon:yes stop_codon:yes gene_type:complete